MKRVRKVKVFEAEPTLIAARLGEKTRTVALLRPMQQIQLRESELGRRYTELGNFSKSADLQSLFTVNSGALEPLNHWASLNDPKGLPEAGEPMMLENTPDLLSMWWRLSALACQPMRETGLDTLQASAGSKSAAR